ncbi:MAG: NAD(P)H-dependent oxidoreductase [Lachnospiraceae bacterium]|nr:NAD(P)H-dependent oxidoreductase [Lachnospiraceae bacterium]
MNIVLIHGQNHKGSSYHIGRMIADKITGEKDVTEFFLPRDLNHFCLGCYKCIEGDENCPFYDEKKIIMNTVEEADLLIFTTPTYCLRASAPMKSFLDLTFTYWMSHRPRKCMFSKKAVVVSTAAGSGAKSAVKDITDALFYWGVPYVKSYGIAVQAMNWDMVKPAKKDKITKDISRLSQKLSNHKKPFVGIKTRFIFKMMGSMQSAGWGSSPMEKEYWENNGWLGKKRPWKD